ncbi:hypothetical protein DTO164E3_8571 [Paecilomyces variotii]|nr:hypothetical protein DTO164E3_8571 [Paecilomyces variotii]KAJ9259453.1 hypothetical protein DTO207G8_1016 [Paecilomyces variotii]KAJ9286877.1 hypothetical protein DTO021C3_5609 [Paecilomyces variotii]
MFRYNLHIPDESTTERLSRISTTPPEFWSRKDWMESRRLRAKRGQSIWRAARQGRRLGTATRNYPEGPFWPQTPRYNPQWKVDAIKMRVLDDDLLNLWEEGYVVYQGMDGYYRVQDPWTGEVFPMMWGLDEP